MALTTKLRKHLAKAVIAGTLALPMALTFLQGAAPNTEQRALAPAPQAPKNWDDALKVLPATDAWINDHFGWRGPMIESYARLRHDVFRRFPTNQVMAGKEGRLFLSAHNKAGEGEPFTAIKSSCGWAFKDEARIGGEIMAFHRAMRAGHVNARLLIVPSAPVVYAEQLPDWQASRCAADRAPAYKVLASPWVDAAARAHTLFPLHEMRAMRGADAVFPLNYFHWSGAGPRFVAGLVQERLWGRAASGGTPIPLAIRHKQRSDVHYLFPGIERLADVGEPDLAGTGITRCDGPDCFDPQFRAVIAKLPPSGVFRNGAPGLAPRLVMLTDSFGFGAAPWFSRYYSEVVFVSTNFLFRLDKEEKAALKKLVFRSDSGDEVLYLYHDVTVGVNRIATDLGYLRP